MFVFRPMPLMQKYNMAQISHQQNSFQEKRLVIFTCV
jgi:hypothetical protein